MRHAHTLPCLLLALLLLLGFAGCSAPAPAWSDTPSAVTSAPSSSFSVSSLSAAQSVSSVFETSTVPSSSQQTSSSSSSASSSASTSTAASASSGSAASASAASGSSSADAQPHAETPEPALRPITSLYRQIKGPWVADLPAAAGQAASQTAILFDDPAPGQLTLSGSRAFQNNPNLKHYAGSYHWSAANNCFVAELQPVWWDETYHPSYSFMFLFTLQQPEKDLSTLVLTRLYVGEITLDGVAMQTTDAIMETLLPTVAGPLSFSATADLYPGYAQMPEMAQGLLPAPATPPALSENPFNQASQFVWRADGNEYNFPGLVNFTCTPAKKEGESDQIHLMYASSLYATEPDYALLGTYTYADGLLTATFTQASAHHTTRSTEVTLVFSLAWGEDVPLRDPNTGGSTAQYTERQHALLITLVSAEGTGAETALRYFGAWVGVPRPFFTYEEPRITPASSSSSVSSSTSSSSSSSSSGASVSRSQR